MQILERFRRKIEFNEDVEDLEDSFKEGCGDANEVIPIVSQAVVKFEKKKWNIPKKQHKYRKDDKLLWRLHKKWIFPLRISSVNVTKSPVSCGFGHFTFFVQC